jgi:glycerophosphoryl diester phosphodiesterase
VLRLIRRERIGARVLLSSFDPTLLTPLRRTRLPYALITAGHADQSLQRAIALGCAAWHPWHRFATPRRIQAAHQAGLRVHAWTVDRPSRARVLAHLGVDGVFTNHPRRLRASG